MHETFNSVRVGRYTLPNRLVMAPMTRSRAKPDGTPGDLAAEYYAQRASVGLVVTEGTQPSDDGQGYLATPGIYTPPRRLILPWGVLSLYKRATRLVQQEREITICLRCGLVLRVETRTDDLTFFYDVEEWRQRCNDPDLGSPALCLTQGTTPGERERTSKQT